MRRFRSSSPRGGLLGWAFVISIGFGGLLSGPLAQDGGGPGPVGGPPGGPPPAEPPAPPAEPTEEEKANQAAEAEAARLLAEKQKRICELFAASKAEFDPEGRLVLTYDFSAGEQGIAADWGPGIESFKKRVRWSRGWEGGSGEHYRDTIVIAEYGVWLHKAMWKDVAVDIQFQMLTEIMKEGDLVAAVFSYDKNKRMVGSNVGEQCIRIDAALKPTGTPIPAKYPVLQAAEERTFGFRLKDGVLAATQSGRPIVDTAKNEKFLSKLGPGHAGVVWRGDYMKGYLIQVVITGTLDPEWTEKALKGAS
jgi:hypothetical protein